MTVTIYVLIGIIIFLYVTGFTMLMSLMSVHGRFTKPQLVVVGLLWPFVAIAIGIFGNLAARSKK